MKRLLLATAWFFLVRGLLAVLAATPLGLALRMIAARHPDGDDALFADFVPRLGDVFLREPRTFTIPVGSMLLALMLVPLGEGFVDRAGAGMLAGRRWFDAVGDAARDLLRATAVSVLGTAVRLAAVACVFGLVRHQELSARGLALPLTLAFLLSLFVGLLLAVRDLAMWPSRERMRGRLHVAMLALMQFPLRMIVVALGARGMQLGFATVAFLASTSPAPTHGAKLLGLYALVIGCWLAAGLARAARFQAFGALATRVMPASERTDDRAGAPGVPSRGPGA